MNVINKTTNSARKKIAQRIREAVIKKATPTLRWFCTIAMEEALQQRLRNRFAHDYTGHLRNSIVADLFCQGQYIDSAVSAAHRQRPPISKKMTASKGRYTFKRDYSGVSSTYLPKINADGMYSVPYQVNSKLLFQVIVSYNVEYADYVHRRNDTVGADKAAWMTGFYAHTDLRLKIKK